MNTKPIFILFLLLLPCQIVAQNLTQEQTPLVWIGGDATNSTIIGKYVKYVTVNNTTVIQIDTVAIKNIARADIQPVLKAFNEGIRKNQSEITILKQNYDENTARITALKALVSMLVNVQSVVQQREAELEPKEFSYLPFGVHQFTHKQVGKGILFAGVELGLLGTSIGYYISSRNNFKRHNNNSYDQWERDRFYDRYISQRNTAGWFLVGTAVAIGLNYCDNFNWFRKNHIQTVAIPTVDMHGNLKVSLALNLKF